MRTTVRHGDVMVAIETAPATIDFEDILDATEVVYDDDCNETPWGMCDGFEHEAVRAEDMPYEANTRAMRGEVWHDGERLVLTLTSDEDFGIYEYLRKSGASRQVAREAVAAGRRRTLDQLTDWYRNGWQWYGVRCAVEVLGQEFEASVWGIDDADYAEKYVRKEIADEVAVQLEDAGYTVVGKPEPEDRLGAKQRGKVVSAEGIQETVYTRAMPRGEWKAEWKRNMASQNWKA